MQHTSGMVMTGAAPVDRPAAGRGGVQVIIAVHSHVQAASWRDAVRTAARPLVEAGAVTPRYVDRCIQTVEEQGPDILVGSGTVLAYARPRDGANTLSLSLARLASPIRFGRLADPVRLLFVFAEPREDARMMLPDRLARALADGLGTRLEGAPTDAAALAVLEDLVESGIDPTHEADAKGILAVLSLGGEGDARISIQARGDGEPEAMGPVAGALDRDLGAVVSEAPRGRRVTRRQGEILALMASGLSRKQIALRLKLSEHTVRHHITRLYSSLGVHDAAHAVMTGVKAGILAT